MQRRFFLEPLHREIPEAQNWALLDKGYKPLDYYNLNFRYYWNRNHPGAQAFYMRIVEFAVKDIQADLLHFDNHSRAVGRDAVSAGASVGGLFCASSSGVLMRFDCRVGRNLVARLAGKAKVVIARLISWLPAPSSPAEAHRNQVRYWSHCP